MSRLLKVLAAAAVAVIVVSSSSALWQQEGLPPQRTTEEKLRRQLREHISKACQRNGTGVGRFEEVGSLSAFVPARDPPWPKEWPVARTGSREGPKPGFVFPSDTLIHVGLPWAVPYSDDGCGQMTSFTGSDFHIVHIGGSLGPHDDIARWIELLRKETGTDTEVTRRVAERVRQLSEESIHRESLRLLLEPLPEPGSLSLEDLFYWAIMVKWCPVQRSKHMQREFQRGNTTVFCFSEPDWRESDVIQFSVYESGGLLRNVFIWQADREPGQEHRSKEHVERLEAICRSILYFALGEPEAAPSDGAAKPAAGDDSPAK
jgi:hypothetical protein